MVILRLLFAIDDHVNVIRSCNGRNRLDLRLVLLIILSLLIVIILVAPLFGRLVLISGDQLEMDCRRRRTGGGWRC